MIIANSKIELFESNKSSSCVEEDIWTTEVLEGSDKVEISLWRMQFDWI